MATIGAPFVEHVQIPIKESAIATTVEAVEENDHNEHTLSAEEIKELREKYGKYCFCRRPYTKIVAATTFPEESEGSGSSEGPESSAPVAAKGKLGFEFAEHANLGDTIFLQWYDGKTYQAANLPFTLQNGVRATYGQINGLGGDFYATYDPISNGTSLADQQNRFKAAYYWLGQDTTQQPKEANAILNILAVEVADVQKALQTGVDPSYYYANIIPDVTTKLEELTLLRNYNEPSYLKIAAINFDHFGADAWTAYIAGHSTAMAVAAQGGPANLELAYAMNAHADHFLEDSFSAGHMRTPRRILHNPDIPLGGPADFCAKLMHDEDNAIGLNVTNRSGSSWHAYGDKRLLDSVGKTNLAICRSAIQTSAAEIYTAWLKRSVIPPSSYGALKLLPLLVNNASNQTLPPLFTPQGERRYYVTNRWTWSFTRYFTYLATITECEVSGMWDYPIVQGPKPVIGQGEVGEPEGDEKVR